METTTIQIVSAMAVFSATILGFLWSLHRDMASLRKETSRDMASLRKDVSEDIAGLRKETREDMTKLRRDVSGDIAGMRQDVVDLRERMARVEGLLEGFVARPQEAKAC